MRIAEISNVGGDWERKRAQEDRESSSTEIGRGATHSLTSQLQRPRWES